MHDLIRWEEEDQLKTLILSTVELGKGEMKTVYSASTK